ncbi:MAG TPA: hypothetical protein VIK87_03675, partial [Sphingomonadales bacterium]
AGFGAVAGAAETAGVRAAAPRAATVAITRNLQNTNFITILISASPCSVIVAGEWVENGAETRAFGREHAYPP